MKTWQRHTLFLVTVAVICAGIVTVLVTDRKDRGASDCRDIIVEISEDQKFVTDEDVRKYIAGEYGQCIGRRLDDIDLSRIEDILDSKSAVRKSEVWTTKDGYLHVSISQRKPVARFNRPEYGFYVDDRGCIFPLHPSYSAPVPEISGAIPLNPGSRYKGPPQTEEERIWVEKVTELLTYIQGSRQWRDKFSAISVRSNGDLVMKSATGPESIIFGPPDEYREKLSRVSKYYSSIAPLRQEGYYKSINVKYNGQIACRR